MNKSYGAMYLRAHADALEVDGVTHYASLVSHLMALKPYFPEIFDGPQHMGFDHMVTMLYFGAEILESEGK